MRRRKAVGPTRPFKIIYTVWLLLSLITFQNNHVTGTYMISTSTETPAGLTTPQTKLSEADFKQEVTDFVTLAGSMEFLKLGENILTNTSLVQRMEKELSAFIEMRYKIEQYYGFRSQRAALEACSFDYMKEKGILLQEYATLLNDCKNTLDNVDLLHFLQTDSHDKLIIHGCSERVKTIPFDMVNLINGVYYISFICAVKSVIGLVEEMAATKYLAHMNANSDLLLKELDYVLTDYEYKHEDENRTQSQIWNTMMEHKMELVKVKRVKETKVMRKAITKFTKSVEQLLKHVQKLKEMEEFSPNETALPKILREDVYEKHLKIPDFPDDSVESWAQSSGVYKVLLMNRILREMLVKVSLTAHQRDTAHEVVRSTQIDLKKAKLFSDVSPTFGKLCENSPHHLVGTCTAENHEICRNVVINWGADNDYSSLEEFLPSNGEKQFPVPHSSLELKHCTCGFRTSCEKGHHFSKRTCYLIPNEYNQCRGGEGYPCNTLPLEPGKHDESCASGYCNRRKNSCEANEVAAVGMKRLNKVVKKKLEALAALVF